MKKLYTLLVLTIAPFVNAQIINIPDAAFKSKLLMSTTTNGIARVSAAGAHIKIDQNNNGEVEVGEVANVGFLGVPNSGITDLTGIQSFPVLEELYCVNNAIVSLTPSATLKDITAHHNALSVLNVADFPMLLRIDCSFNALTSVHIAHPMLNTITLNDNSITNFTMGIMGYRFELNLSNNLIASLDLSNHIIYKLICNQTPETQEIHGLTSVNLANCFNDFAGMEIHLDYNKITDLNITGATIGRLHCANNQLTTLDCTGSYINELW